MKEIDIKDIFRAMENQEMQAYYQPQYDAMTNRIVSSEALARWVCKDGTIIPPISFIPKLEKNDFINELDWYMIEEVCKMLKEQPSEHTVPVAVNFSRWHVTEKGFVDKLSKIADRYKIDHNLLEVEITESALIDESKKIKNWIEQIKEAGFHVAIDDFGSGLSSLQFVKDMPADIIKIDKSLLDGNCANDKEKIVLESVFYFANRLKMTTIAEGVETREQLGFLRTCDCKKIQGFLFSKPLEKKDYLASCRVGTKFGMSEDILKMQAWSCTTQLLLDAIFMKYPLVIFANLTRNSYYMMEYDNFSSTSCPAAGVFDELIYHGAQSMHPEDREQFKKTFDRHHLLSEHEKGEKSVKLVTRQIGDDGIYRKVEVTDFFVKNPSVDDVLVISLCDNV